MGRNLQSVSHVKTTNTHDKSMRGVSRKRLAVTATKSERNQAPTLTISQSSQSEAVARLVARARDPQDHTVLARRHDVPLALPVGVVEDARPGDTQRGRQLPAHHLVVEPQADEVALAVRGVLEGLAPVQHPHVVEEADVARHHGRRHLVLARHEVHRVQGLRLRLRQPGYARRARRVWRVADQQAP